MAKSKIYTVKENTRPSSSKNHILIRASYKKGLTGVTIRWIGAMHFDRYSQGWSLQSDQVPYLHLGFEIAEAENRINKISI